MAKQFGQNGWQMAKLTIFGHLQSILDRFGDLCGHFQPTIAEQKQWDGNQAKVVRNTATGLLRVSDNFEPFGIHFAPFLSKKIQ